MTSQRRHAFLVMHAVVVYACVTVLPGCGDTADTATQEKSATAANKASPNQVARDVGKSKDTSLTFGDERFDFDVVICLGTSMATITASDSQQHSNSPVVSIKIYDPAISGGQSINTVSALFERGDYAEHWTLDAGTVDKNGDIVTGSGHLKGAFLIPKPDGTRQSAPMEGDDLLPFEVRIEC